jgi:hypothetical protein
MARRAGLLNGLAGFLLAIVLIAAVSAIIASQADADTIHSNLRSLGIPTSSSEWSDIGTLAGIASLAAMLLGAVVGGVLGERWHSKLARRAVSGKYGPDRSQRHAGDDEPTHATPTPQPNERDQAAPGRFERDRSDGSGASRVD